MTAAAAICGLVMRMWIGPAKRQRAAVTWIENSGGKVSFKAKPLTEYPLLKKLRDWLPRDYIDDVVQVTWDRDPVRRDPFRQGPRSMAQKAIDELWRKSRQGITLTDEDLEGLLGLRILARYGDRAMDLAHLEMLAAKGSLRFDGVPVTDTHLAHQEVLKARTILGLKDPPAVTDADLAHLEGLTSLKVLDLTDTQVTDAGLEHLRGLADLEQLTLDHTQVTDAGLVHLKDLISLRSLRAHATQVTSEGKAKLKTELPQLH